MRPETLLLRQINPSFIQNGRVTSQAFRPTPKDDSQLSVYNGDLITPEKSWQHFTLTLLFRSSGVMAVSKSQCDEQIIPVIDDPATFPEHAYLDFSGMSKKDIERKAKVLTSKAQDRDWLYQA